MEFIPFRKARETASTGNGQEQDTNPKNPEFAEKCQMLKLN